MKIYGNWLRSALLAVAALVAVALPEASLAQTVTKVPAFVGNQAWLDLGNGPLELFVHSGSARVLSMSGTGTGGNGSVSGTGITLTASAAANPPCVGCVISGTGITSGTTVTAFNGTTGITLSAAMSVANGTALSWGMACPTSGLPPSQSIALRGGVDDVKSAVPFYTQARLCAYGDNSAGGSLVTFSIGAH